MTDKQKFALRMIAFLTFSLLIPSTFLIIKFNLFHTTTQLQIGLAEIIVLSVFIGVVSVLIKYYLDGLKTKYSLVKQILQGVIKLILPLCVLLLLFIFLQDNLLMIKEALYVIIPCEMVAIVINPLPKWCFDNNVEGIGEIADKIFKKKDGE